MIIIPTIKFCSSCSQPIIDDCMMSGNTFGATFWTDGVIAAPMIMRECRCTLCPHCNAPIWLNELESVKPKGWYGEDTLAEYPEAKGPSMFISDDYMDLLANHSFPFEKERYLREHVWHYNNDFRRDTDRVSPLSDREKENLLALVELLSDDTQENFLEKAEIFREMGDFSHTKELLEKVTDEKLQDMKKTIEIHIEKEDPFVAKVIAS